MKELYLDTANILEIKELLRTDAIQGVTTNPSLMAKEAKSPIGFTTIPSPAQKWKTYVEGLEEICKLFQACTGGARKHLSVEVITLDPQKMYSQAVALDKALGFSKYQNVDLHIKIPVMFETLGTISRLVDDGIKVNATACMTALQAKLASDAGASIVSFFYNRMLDGNLDAVGEICRFSEISNNSRIICGSIRKPDDIRICWMAGSDIVTASTKVIKEAISHPKTTEAINTFQKDIDSWLS